MVLSLLVAVVDSLVKLVGALLVVILAQVNWGTVAGSRGERGSPGWGLGAA